MAEQFACTVLKIGTQPNLLEPQDWTFPSKEVAMIEVVDGDINSAILYQGTLYYAEETLADLETAANAGGGGSSSYLVYTAKITLPIIVSSTSGLLEVGKRYQINTLEAGDDFTNVGYTGQPFGFTATGTTPTNWTNSTLVTNLTDTVPVAAIIQNTIGAETEWVSNVIGDYSVILTTPLDAAKFFIPTIIGYGDNGNAANYIPIADGSAVIGYYILQGAGQGGGTITNISMEFVDANFDHVHMSDLVGSQGEVPVQFFYYP